MKTHMKLFEPIQINSMLLKNRICQAPILEAPDFATKLAITDNTIEWYESRARGGAGFVMTGCMFPFQLQTPAIVEGLPKLADAIHKHGAKLGVQIGMWGPLLNLGPSAPPFPNAKDKKQTFGEVFKTPKQLQEEAPVDFHVVSVDEIRALEDQLAASAKILKDNGVDCVELHCSHGGAVLMCSFISPYYNHREDEYGGSWENRLRFPVEIVRKMREQVGPDYPLMARINGNELLGEAGITPEDAARHIGPAMEAAGIDCLDISQGSIMHAPQGILLPMYYEQGCFMDHVAKVRANVGVPVIGAGRMWDLDVCEQMLQEGKTDLIHFGRQLIADPETPNKYLSGLKDEIRPCIACNEGCGLPCSVNYDIGPDRLPLLPTDSDKTILVIGSGVAGMEAARVAALRGYKVILMERREVLGGTVGTFENEPTCSELSLFTDYLKIQMEKRQVEVRLGCEATVAAINQIKPDVIIIAAGAEQDIPDRLTANPKVLDILEAIRQRNQLGQKIVVWGHAYGSETAISLGEEGKQVTLIGNGTHQSLLGFASNARRWWLMKKLSDIDPVRIGEDGERAANVEVHYQTRLGEVGPDSLEVLFRDGTRKQIDYDHLIVARARKKNNDLLEMIENLAPEVYTIGDYAQVNVIQKAVFAANEVVRSLDTDYQSSQQLTVEPGALF